MELELSPELDADSVLRKRVLNYLSDRTQPTLKEISIRAHNGCVTMSGKVRSFYEKQLCICSCQRVAGVVRLIDELEVTESGSR